MAIVDKQGVEFLLEVLKHNGVAASTVKDGHIILFKRTMLQEILDKHLDNETISIVIKRPDFKG